MTREEVIKSALKFLVHKQQEQGSWGYADNDDTNEVSWDEIIEWIDQQPCGDCISREAVLDLAKSGRLVSNGNYKSVCDAINGLPSVEVETCGDCVSRQAVRIALLNKGQHSKRYKLGETWELNLMEIEDALKELPSVEPEIEKCEDCINRKDMIKKLNNLCNNICEYSKKQRKSMCDACNLSLVFDMINNAKSVEPERKPGKWIENDTIRQCNMCRALYSKGQRCGAYHYCPNCGAKMEEDV